MDGIDVQYTQKVMIRMGTGVLLELLKRGAGNKMIIASGRNWWYNYKRRMCP